MMKSLLKTIQNRISSIIHNGIYKKYYKNTTDFIKQKPLSAFFLSLLLLFLIIIAGNMLNKPKPEKEAGPITKMVHAYNIGQAPLATFQAKVDKAGVVKIMALTGGVVQGISVNEGDSVGMGTQMFTLSSTYQGGNTPAIQAQIAREQYQNMLTTFNDQKDTIRKQKDIATITRDNFSSQQSIATQSANDTNSLINANQVLLDTLNQQLSQAQGNGSSAASLIPLQSQINQFQAAQNQLKQQLHSFQEQTDTSKPQGRLADAQKDLALKQLDLQEKTLQLNKEVSKLQADLAAVSAQAMYPASPFAGTVERIYVRIGQQVSPGTPLAEISSNNKQATAIALVPQNIVMNVSKLDTSTLHINGHAYDVRPTFISSEATDGQLYSIIYTLPDNENISVTDGSYITVDIPVGSSNTSSVVPFIPLDAIFQTQDSNELLIIDHNKAVSKKVTLGEIFGSFVQVTSGLITGDQVITDRNVVSGDTVQAN